MFHSSNSSNSKNVQANWSFSECSFQSYNFPFQASLQDVQGIFLFLGSLLCLAVLIFLVEVLYRHVITILKESSEATDNPDTQQRNENEFDSWH